MAKKRQRKGAPKWMNTYGDMMTLVLVFFIMLFSLSQLDAIKFKQLKESFDQKAVEDGIVEMESEIFDISPGEMTQEEVQEVVEQRVEKTEELDDLYEKIVEFIAENGLEDEVEAERDIDGVKIIITDNLLFDTAEAEIKPQARSIVDEISQFFHQVSNDVHIEGHTDNRPINSVIYPSNWELSSARASSIIRYLIDNHELDDERFTSIGYGETEPIAPNDGEENWQKNRRVVIFILEEFARR